MESIIAYSLPTIVGLVIASIGLLLYSMWIYELGFEKGKEAIRLEAISKNYGRVNINRISDNNKLGFEWNK